MSAAAPTVDAGAATPAKKGKKKLIIIIAAALLVVLIGGGAAMFLMKKKAHDAESAEEGAAPAAEHAAAKRDLKHPPTFLPLDPFVVNLADKEVDRYAQIGITLEIADAKFADEMKTYMPAIRNGILMILAHKSSRELLERSGKEKLAGQIQREAARTMGLAIDEPDDADEAPAAANADAKAAKESTKVAAADDEEVDPPKKGVKAAKKKKKAKDVVENPIQHVHFSNFIVQ
ncbi:MAG: flagellar basal body-associated FliL family protein [Rhizobacter sp.]|nr:flagellar basal body-associated FliL family protein [Rhizobacter sp.]